MINHKRLVALFIIPVLLMAGCSGTVQSLNTPAALPAQVSNSAPVQFVSEPQQVVTPNTALAAFQSTFEQIYTNVNPSVVNIQVEQTSSGSTNFSPNGNSPFGNSPFGFGSQPPQTVQQALGSGFVWDAQGHIVTNNHVVSGADKITVTFSDGTTVDANLVGADPNSDLAVIQVNVPASQLHPVQIGDSTQVKVGQIAIAIGNPFGLSGTMTEGIVSALQRSLPVGLDNANQQGPTYSIPDIIQTDAAINPGNSGGVLVNDQGQVIGVTAAIRSSTDSNSGIGFVIPSAIVQRVVPSLIQNGSYAHPWIGISGTSMDSELAQAMNLDPQQKGALVIDVTPNSPAEKAGLLGSNTQTTIAGQQTVVGGDVIIAIDNQPVNDFEDLASYLTNSTQVGQTVTLTILRQGKQQTVQLTLGVLPANLGQ
jgi:serine protease Do